MLRIIERYEADGRRIECGFADLPDDAGRPEAPATLTATDHAIGFAAVAAMVTGMLMILGMFALAIR
jgi:hypothetical protein